MLDDDCNDVEWLIVRETQLTCSIGCSVNKWLAKVNVSTIIPLPTLLTSFKSKICTDINKPNGQYFLLGDRKTILNFVDKLPINKVPGIGKVCMPSGAVIIVF